MSKHRSSSSVEYHQSYSMSSQLAGLTDRWIRVVRRWEWDSLRRQSEIVGSVERSASVGRFCLPENGANL